MQVWWLFPIKTFVFFEYMQVWGTWSSRNLHILKKINILMPKVHKTCIYSKKTKKWSSNVTKPAYTQKNQKNQKLIHLCQSVPHRVWNFWFFWVYAGLVTFPYQNFCFFWVYAGLVTFHYQNFWFFWVYAGFVHFWHQNVVFLSICRFGEPQVSNLHVCNLRMIRFVQSIFLFQYVSN